MKPEQVNDRIAFILRQLHNLQERDTMANDNESSELNDAIFALEELLESRGG